jgi:acyl-CoA thioesterase FadM
LHPWGNIMFAVFERIICILPRENRPFGVEEFTCALNIKKEGLKYIFNQDIIRLHDRKLCARGKVEVVCLIDGKLSQPSIFDEAFKEYIQE